MSKNHYRLILSVLFLGAFFFAHGTSAQTIPPTILTVDMSVGSTDASTGGQVTMLQDFLRATGYFNRSSTGYFASVTKASVKHFQRDNNISPAEGFVGPITRAKIALLSTGGTGGIGIIGGIDPITVLTLPASSSTMVNVSSRAQTLSGDGVAISGFTISGNGGGCGSALNNAVNCGALLIERKQVLIRGLGPTLLNFGISNALVDPTISLRDSSGHEIASNDNWGDADRATIQANNSIGPLNNSESAILATLGPGSYTVILSGNNISNNNNIGTVEVYDIAGDAELTSVSTRGRVDGGDDVLISGMIVRSNTNQSQTFVFRGIGPSLASSGLTGVMSDPTITLYDSAGTAIATNNDWMSGGNQSDDEARIRDLGLTPSNDRESALIKTLPPGAYTIVQRGANNSTGLGLVEIYKVAGVNVVACISTTPQGQSQGQSIDCGPEITSISPSNGPVGTEVVIYGSGLTTSTNVKFGSGVISSPTYLTAPDTGIISIAFPVPGFLQLACHYLNPPCEALTPQVTPGDYPVSVTNSNGTSNSKTFTVTSGSANSHTGTLTANPNPIITNETLGVTTLSWTTDSPLVEVHVNSPSGALFARAGGSGSAPTGMWVGNNSKFYLQDVSNNYSLTTEHTLATLTVTLSALPPSNAHPPVGYFDNITTDGLALGWAYDPDQSVTSIPVHFYIDGTYAGQTTTNTSRPDVNQAFGITGNHGYSWSIPNSYRNGVTHQMSVYGIDIGGNGSTNSQLTNSPRSFNLTVSTPPPTASFTINGSHDVTVNVGEALNSSWSSTNGISYSSTYTNSCTPGGVGTGGINTASGNSIGYPDASMAGCDFTITYRVVGANGQVATAVVVDHVRPATTLNAPTASFTINGSHDVTVNVGEALNSSWSSTNGISYSSTYTNSCTPGATGTWGANTASGNSTGYPDASMAGCDFTITYRVVGANGQAAAASATDHVVGTHASNMSAHTQTANVLDALKSFMASVDFQNQTANTTTVINQLLNNLKSLLTY